MNEIIQWSVNICYFSLFLFQSHKVQSPWCSNNIDFKYINLIFLLWILFLKKPDQWKNNKTNLIWFCLFIYKKILNSFCVQYNNVRLRNTSINLYLLFAKYENDDLHASLAWNVLIYYKLTHTGYFKVKNWWSTGILQRYTLNFPEILHHQTIQMFIWIFFCKEHIFFRDFECLYQGNRKCKKN